MLGGIRVVIGILGLAAAASAVAADPSKVLRVAFPTLSGLLYAADRVSFAIERGEVLGLVGESGSGKSVTCRAILRSTATCIGLATRLRCSII